MKVHRQSTYYYYLIAGLWISFPIIFGGLFIMSAVGQTADNQIYFWIGIEVWWALAAILALIYTKRISKFLKNRQAQLVLFCSQKNYQYTETAGARLLDFDLMTLKTLDGERDPAYKNYISSSEWEYCDYEYSLYNKTKYGEYRAHTIHYAVMTAKLPRALPNVFFDSSKSNRRQFRFVFQHEQKHSLEGNFDQYFTTYFPQDYTIDSMSFITPEVMQEMIAASAYDIEIAGDRLFLYGPIFSPEQEIPDMASRIVNIKQKLLNNVMTYRDDRLPYELGRQRVGVGGMELKKSNVMRNLSIAFVIAYVLMRILLASKY